MRLIRFARTAPAVIRDRVNRLESSRILDPLDARPLADRPQSGEDITMEESERPLQTEHITVKLEQNTGQQSKGKKESQDKLPHGGQELLQGNSKGSASPNPSIRKKQDDLEIFANAGSDIEVKTSRNQDLIWAVRKGHVSLVQRLLDRDSNSIEHKDMLWWTPLNWAAFTANLDLFRLLLSRGADIHARPYKGHSMLHLLSNRGMNYRKEVDDYVGSSSDRRAIGLELLRRGHPVDEENLLGETPLLLAAKCGLEDLVVMLILKGADLHTRDREGYPPLMLAAQNRHMGVVEAIIKRQKKDAKWGGGMCLVQAASQGMKPAVGSLLDAGAMIETTNADGKTALISAASNHHENVIRLLLNKGANINSKGQYGRTPIMWAVGRDWAHWGQHRKKALLETIKLLIHGGASVHGHKGQRTPLHLAVYLGILSAVDLLLRAGADPLARDRRGKSPLDLAHNKHIRDRLEKELPQKGRSR